MEVNEKILNLNIAFLLETLKYVIGKTHIQSRNVYFKGILVTFEGW